MTLAKAKQQLRAHIRLLKKQHDTQSLQLLSEAVMAKIERNKSFEHAHVVLIYASLNDEVSTFRFIEKWHKEKTFLLPKVNGDMLTLHPYAGNDSLHRGSYGIAEPITEEFHDFEMIDLAIVPGMAFDPDGNRLGRGRGYYDRLFAGIGKNVYKIGVAFPFQIVERIPADPTDIKMDFVCY